MMIKVGVRDDHTAEARSARRPGRAASAGTAFAGQPVTQTLNPPPPSFETCKTVGNGFICDGARTESYGPDDTGIACASGAGAFDIFYQGTHNQHAIRFYNTDGNLTRRVIHAQRPVRHPARTAHGLALARPRQALPGRGTAPFSTVRPPGMAQGFRELRLTHWSDHEILDKAPGCRSTGRALGRPGRDCVFCLACAWPSPLAGRPDQAERSAGVHLPGGGRAGWGGRDSGERLGSGERFAGLVGHADPEPGDSDRAAVLGVLPGRQLVHGRRHLHQGLGRGGHAG